MPSESTKAANAPSPFLEIVEQHAEEAAFLWLLRSQAAHEPHYDLNDLAELEARIDAHIDGLRNAGEAGWEVARDALELEGAGEVFAASVLAIDGGGRERMRRVLEAVEAAPEAARGLISALGWCPFVTAKRVADQLLAAEPAVQRMMGLAAYAVHRQPPGPKLDEALTNDDPLLRARALKAVGELGITAKLRAVNEHLPDEDPNCAFWAAWSATLLGSDAGLKVLRQLAGSDAPFAERALELAARRLGASAALGLVPELARDEATLRGAIITAGAAGNPAKIPWLLEQMQEEKHARVAGETFSMITGLDIAAENMDGDEPEGFESGPTDEPEDEDVSMDADEDLPWPKIEELSRWWDAKKGGFSEGQRYLAGSMIDETKLRELLGTGYQRQRAAAALELAMLRPGQALFETRARADVQRRALGHS